MLTTTCDQCQNDLTDGGGYPSYRIKLTVERRPNKGGGEYAVHIPRPLPASEAHFCGVSCLSAYLADPQNKPRGIA